MSEEWENKYIKEIEVEYRGKIEKIVLRKLKWGKYNESIQQCTKAEMIGKKIEYKVDSIKLRELLVLNSILICPDGFKEDMESEHGEYLAKVIDSFYEKDNEKKSNTITQGEDSAQQETPK